MPVLPRQAQRAFWDEARKDLAFIGVPILMGTEALAGIAMPARASTFNSVDTLMTAEALVDVDSKCS